MNTFVPSDLDRVCFLGHHLNDQLETCLMRLTRASGLKGLAGMRHIVQEQNGIFIHRPLLGFPKKRLWETCNMLGLKPVNDPANDDSAFDRTRARQVRGF